MPYHTLFLQSAKYIKLFQNVLLFYGINSIFILTLFVTYFFGKRDEHWSLKWLNAI